MKEIICFAAGLMVGGIMGICVMALLQINHQDAHEINEEEHP